MHFPSEIIRHIETSQLICSSNQLTGFYVSDDFRGEYKLINLLRFAYIKAKFGDDPLNYRM